MSIQKQDALTNQINAKYQEVEGLARSAVEAGIELGGMLVEKRKTLGRGEWGPWLEKHFEGSRSHAYNFIKLYEERDKLLEGNVQRVGQTSLRGALQVLSATEPFGGPTAPQRPADMPLDEFRVFLQAYEDGLEASCAMGVDLESIARRPENERRGWVAQAAWESMIAQGRRYARILPDPEFPELNNLTPEYLTEIHAQAEKLRWWVRQVEWLESIVRACDWPPGRGMPNEAFDETLKTKPLSNLYDDGNDSGLRSPRGHLREWLGDVV
jgi:Protein of unknown function (DUF3102)